jgi:hypothetical protein
MVIEQRHQLRIVAGLARGQPARDRGLPLIGQGVDFVVSPPRERPIAWSSGSSAAFL